MCTQSQQPSISGFRCTNSSEEQWGYLRNNSRWSSKWLGSMIPHSALCLCHNTGRPSGQSEDSQLDVTTRRINTKTRKKGIKEGFNPSYWMFVDNTCEGLKCVLAVGNEGRLFFCPRLGYCFLRKHCSPTSELFVWIRIAKDGEDEGMKDLFRSVKGALSSGFIGNITWNKNCFGRDFKYYSKRTMWSAVHRKLHQKYFLDRVFLYFLLRPSFQGNNQVNRFG